MFGLDGLLNDSKGSGWKLVYVDFENDVLLVGPGSKCFLVLYLCLSSKGKC